MGNTAELDYPSLRQLAEQPTQNGISVRATDTRHPLVSARRAHRSRGPASGAAVREVLRPRDRVGSVALPLELIEEPAPERGHVLRARQGQQVLTLLAVLVR